METKVTFSEFFIKSLRVCAVSLNDKKEEDNLKAPFNKFVLSVKNNRQGDLIQVYRAKEIGIDSEDIFYLYK